MCSPAQVSDLLELVWCAMTPSSIDYRARVLYIRDARKLVDQDQVAMLLSSAVFTALANHLHGEAPVVIGKNLKLVGIDAILAVRELEDFPCA